MNKAALRQWMRERKVMHSAEWLFRESQRIMLRLENQDYFRRAHTIVLYHSLPDEVDTHAFILKWYKDKRLLLPKVVGENLSLHEVQDVSLLQQGAFGIMEPVGEEFTEFDEIELAVVPGMAFDGQGNRLGRGRGYYDRLLPRLRHARKVGVCFPFQRVELVEMQPHDQPVDEVIS